MGGGGGTASLYVARPTQGRTLECRQCVCKQSPSTGPWYMNSDTESH